MSFILDALKKSESDRQRQTGPALFEVKVAPPKTGFPVWAIAIVVLLVINMAIVGWMLVRRMSHDDASATANAAPQAVTPPVAAASPPAPAYSAPPPTQPSPQPIAQPAPTQQAVPPQQAALAPPSGQPAAPQGPASNAPGVNQPNTVAAEARSSTGGAASNGGTSEPTLEPPANPDDYVPATEGSTSPFKGRVKRGTESGLPLYQDAALSQGSNLPQLRLDLHVYAAKPQDRFALINMHRIHEGDTLPEGVHVDGITPDGVVLSRNGSKFLLPRE